MGNLHQARNPCSSENMTPALCPLQSPSRSACDGACRMLSETGKELTIWKKTQEMHLFTALWKKGLNICTTCIWLYLKEMGFFQSIRLIASCLKENNFITTCVMNAEFIINTIERHQEKCELCYWSAVKKQSYKITEQKNSITLKKPKVEHFYLIIKTYI